MPNTPALGKGSRSDRWL